MFVIKPFRLRALAADVTVLWKHSAHSQAACEDVLLFIRLICDILRFLDSGNNRFEKNLSLTWRGCHADVELKMFF